MAALVDMTAQGPVLERLVQSPDSGEMLSPLKLPSYKKVINYVTFILSSFFSLIYVPVPESLINSTRTSEETEEVVSFVYAHPARAQVP